MYQKYKKYKRKLNKKLVIFLAPSLSYLYINFVHFTSKKFYHISTNTLKDKNYVVLCWHNKIAMFALIYKAFRESIKLKCIISTHSDGAVLSKFASLFGFSIIKGSSNRGGVSVIINGLKFLKNGYDVLIAPDGPRGPVYSVAVGAVALAQKTNRQLVVVSFDADNYWQLNSWDKAIIPKPFTRLHYYISDPFDISNLELYEAKIKIKNEMNKIGKNNLSAQNG